MENDNEEFLKAMQPSTAPKGEGGMHPSDFGLDTQTADAPLKDLAAIPVDYEMDIVRPPDDNSEFMKAMGITTSDETGKPTKMSMQEYAKTLPEDMPYDERQKVLRAYRRDNIDNVQYLGETIDNPLTALGASLFAQGAGLLKVGEDITGLDLHSQRAISMAQNIDKELSASTKLAGDVGASLIAGAGIYAPSMQLGLQTLGEGKSYGEAAEITLGSVVVGKLGEAFVTHIVNNPNITSSTAKLMLDLNQGRITEREFDKLMQGVPKEDRALVFAEGNKLFKGHIVDAVSGDSILQAKLGKRLEARKAIATSFAADKLQMEDAAAEYSKMRETIATELPDLYNTSGLNEQLGRLTKIYATDPSGIGTAVRQVIADIDGPISMDAAIDIRQNINAILRKPSIKGSHNAKRALSDIKTNLDSFIEMNIAKPRAEGLPSYKEVLDSAINSYSQTKNNYLLGQLIDKNTKNDYAVNWEKLNADIRKLGLHSDNITLAIPVLKAMEKRFVNDAKLGNAIVSTGAGEGTGALGVWSKAIKTVLDFVSPVFNRSRHTDLRIQKDIIKSIENPNNDYLGFIDDMLANKSMPLESKAALNSLKQDINAPKQLEAPTDFTVRPDGTAVRQSGDAAQDALSREPINTTIVDETNMPSTSVKPSEDIINVEWWKPTSTVVTPDGHILSMEELLRAESLPDNMRLPEKASAPIKSFFDMKYKMKTDPDLIKAREEVKKATTQPAKDKAKDRLLKQLEYQRLREQGVKPSEAHRMSIRSSSEVGGALAGGTINGVTIDDDGNIQVDPEAFLIGAAGGAAVVKGGKQLGKQLSEAKEYYHGTESVFTKFDASQNPQGLVWFTNNKDYAKTAGPNLHTVKLDVKNTFDFTKQEHLDMLLKSGKVDKEEIDDLVNKGYAHREQPYIIELLKKLGFDSVYTEQEGKRKAIAVFNVDKQAKHKKIENKE